MERRSRGGPDLARYNNNNNNNKKKNSNNKKKQPNAKDGPLINLYNYLLVGELGGEQFRLNSSVDATNNFFRYRRNETKQNNNKPEKKRVATVLTTTSSRKDHKSSSTGKKRNTDLHNAKEEDQPKGDVEQSSHNHGEASLDKDYHFPVVSLSPKQSFNHDIIIFPFESSDLACWPSQTQTQLALELLISGPTEQIPVFEAPQSPFFTSIPSTPGVQQFFLSCDSAPTPHPKNAAQPSIKETKPTKQIINIDQLIAELRNTFKKGEPACTKLFSLCSLSHTQTANPLIIYFVITIDRRQHRRRSARTETECKFAGARFYHI